MPKQIGFDDPACLVKIADARALAEQYDLQGVMILAITRAGMIEAITYGDHPAQKVAMGNFADTIVNNTLTKVPFQTMFGWGNGGVPLNITEEEYAALKDQYNMTAEDISAFIHPDAVDPTE